MSMTRLFVRTFLFRVLNAILGFVVVSKTSKYMGPDFRSVYNDVSVNSGVYSSTLGGFGVYQNRAINKLHLPLEQVVDITWTFWLACSALTWIILLVLIPFGVFSQLANTSWLFVLLGSPLWLSFGFSSRLLNYLNQIKRLNIANIVQNAVFAVMVIALTLLLPHVPGRDKVWWVCISWFVSQLASAVIGHWLLYRSTGYHPRLRWHRDLAREFLAFGGKISFANLVERVNYRCDYWLVAYILTQTDQGIYGVAVAASELMSFVTATLTTLVTSRVASSDPEIAMGTTERTFRVMVTATFLSALVASAVYPLFVVPAFGARYIPTIAPFRVLVLGMIFLGPAELLLNYFTNHIGGPRISVQLELCSAVLNVLIGLVLIHKAGVSGAALGSSIGYFFEFVATVWLYRKIGRPGKLLRFHLSDYTQAFPFLRRSR